MYLGVDILNQPRLLRSANAGVDWEVLSGFSFARPIAIAIDPFDSQTLYAGTEGEGIYKSINKGETWFPANNGIEQALIIKIVPDTRLQNRLYALSYEPGIQRVFLTDNGGESWVNISSNLGDEANRVNDIVVDYIGNFPILYAGTDRGIYRYNPNNVWQGTIGQNSTWSGINHVVGNLDVSSGTVLTIEPGTDVRALPNVGITVHGELIADGTSEATQFRTVQQDAKWNGLDFRLGSGDLVKSCTISRAYTGITIEASSPNIERNILDDCSVGVDVYTIDAHAQPAINDNEIRNCGTGLYFHQAFPLEVRRNHIHNNDIGIVTFQSSPVFHYNVIENNRLFGVWSDDADPRFGDYVAGDKGCNTIRYNTTEEGTADLFVKSGSAFFGYYDGQQSFGGFNSIFSSEVAEVRCIVTADYNAYVLAHLTWWGQYPPDERLFCLSQDAKVDYSKPLSGPPENCEGTIEQWALSADEEEQILRSAVRDRGNRNYGSALNTYSTFVTGRPNSIRARRALRELRQTYRDYQHWSNDSTLRGQLINSLTTIAGNHPNTPVRKLALVLWAEELHANRAWNTAIDKYQQIIQNQPNTHYERTAWFSLFSIYAYGLHDPVSASSVLATLQTKYADDPHTTLAQIRFAGMSHGPSSAFGKPHPSGDDNQSLLPTTYGLDQNYPNPFNPITIITFRLPQDEHVVLKIYDM